MAKITAAIRTCQMYGFFPTLSTNMTHTHTSQCNSSTRSSHQYRGSVSSAPGAALSRSPAAGGCSPSAGELIRGDVSRRCADVGHPTRPGPVGANILPSTEPQTKAGQPLKTHQRRDGRLLSGPVTFSPRVSPSSWCQCRLGVH